MKTTNLLYVLLLLIFPLFTSCITTEEEVRYQFEDFVEMMQKGEGSKACSEFGAGNFTKDFDAARMINAMMGLNTFDFSKYKGIKQLEFIPDFSDVALIIPEIEDCKMEITYFLHLDNSQEWKIYGVKSGDFVKSKNYITEEALAEVGIYTISDSDYNTYFK